MVIREALICPSVIGRGPELAELDAALRVAAEGAGDFILLAGEPGIGKSRLAVEVQKRAASQGFEVLLATAYEGDESVPYAVLADLLASSAEVADARAQIVALMTGDSTGRKGDASTGLRRALFEGLYDRLAAIALTRPLLLIFDDLQWTDPTTLGFIRLVGPRVRGRRMVILATARDDALVPGTQPGDLVLEFDRRRLVRVLPLAPLAEPDVRTMIMTTLGGPLSGADEARVVELAEGNPFFIEELLREVTSGGRPEVGVPNFRDVILNHFRSLSLDARDVAEFAAVAGRPFTASLLPEQPTSKRDSAISELLVSQVIRPVEGLEGAFTFRHAIVARAIYEAIPTDRRRSLHAEVARALQQDGQTAVVTAAVASHWRLAGESGRALEAVRHAAESAAAVYAFDEAATMYGTLLDSLPPGDSEERVQTLTARGLALSAIGGLAAALRDFEAAAAMAQRLALPVAEAGAERVIGRQLALMGRGREAVEHLRRAVGLLRPFPPDSKLAWVQASLGRVLVMEEDEAEAIEWARLAVAGADALGDRAIRASALNTIGVCLQRLGDPDEGLRSIEEAIREAEASGSADEITRAHNNYIHGLIRAFTPLAVLLPAVERGLAAIERCGFIAGALHTRSAVAKALIFMGRWEDAERLLENVRTHPTDAVTLTASEYELAVGLLRFYRGDWVGAKEALSASLGASEASDSLDPGATASAYLARTQRLDRRPATARTTIRPALEKALSRASGEHLAPLVRERVTQLIAEGDTTAAASLIEAMEHVPGEGDRPDRRFAVHAARGALLSAAGERDVALGEYEAAVSVAIGHDRPLLAAEVLVEAGIALLRRRSAPERERGQALLDRARGLIPESSSSFIERHLDSAGLLHAVSSVPVELRSLSSREREVLSQVGDGRTNRQIAETLVLSERTVERHVGSIYAKLGLEGRSAAIALVARLTARSSVGPAGGGD